MLKFSRTGGGREPFRAWNEESAVLQTFGLFAMNDNRQKAPPTRDELIHALKERRNQVVELSQENQAMIEQIQKDNGRLQQQEATIAKLKSDAMKSTVPTIEFPKIQCVRLDDAFRTGLNFGCGLLVAPLVMVFLVFSYMMIIASMAGSSP